MIMNNPLNIRKSTTVWHGEVRDQPGQFASFENLEYGLRAAFVVINTYITKHGLTTIRGIINRWAPPNENDTDSYVEYVASRMRQDADTPLRWSPKQRKELVAAMARMESGTTVTPVTMQLAYDMSR